MPTPFVDCGIVIRKEVLRERLIFKKKKKKNKKEKNQRKDLLRGYGGGE